MKGATDQGLLMAIPLRAPGAELHWQTDGQQRKAILKQRRPNRYRLLSPGSAWIWSLCDGSRTVAAIAAEIAAKGGPAQPGTVLAKVRQLAADGLLLGTGAEGAAPPAPARGFVAFCRRLLTWRITFRQVDPWVSWGYRHIGRYFFMRTLRLPMVALMLGGFVAFLYRWLHQTGSLFAASGHTAWLLPLFMFACMPLHEGAHAMTTKHFGREVIGAGFGWFWLGPFFYVDTSDMWLASRRERVLVSLAGSLSDLSIAGTCSLLALYAPPPLAALFMMFAAALYLLTLGNLSPMLEYDGYYALADLLNRPNLRPRALYLLCQQFGPHRLRWHELRPYRVELAYGISSVLYTAFLLVMNTRFNYAYFSGVFGAASGSRTTVLAWAVTLLLMLIFLSGLLGDMRRLSQPPLAMQNAS